MDGTANVRPLIRARTLPATSPAATATSRITSSCQAWHILQVRYSASFVGIRVLHSKPSQFVRQRRVQSITPGGSYAPSGKKERKLAPIPARRTGADSKRGERTQSDQDAKYGRIPVEISNAANHG